MLGTDPVPVRLASGHQVRLVTRYDDVRRAMSDPRMSRAALMTPDAPTIIPGLQSPDMLPNMDPPDHTSLRRLVAKAFAIHNVELLRPGVDMIAADLVDRMLAAGPPADLVGALAQPLPSIVICEVLGLAHDERGPLLAFIEVVSNTTAFDQEAFNSTGAVAASHLLGLIERKRHQPADDLLSGLTQVHDDDGDRLSEAELLMTVLLLIGAGQETTMAQLTKSVLLLSHHPDQWARLVAWCPTRSRNCSVSWPWGTPGSHGWHVRTWNSPAGPSKPAPRCSRSSTWPTVTPPFSPIRTGWTWTVARRPNISRSVPARDPAKSIMGFEGV